MSAVLILASVCAIHSASCAEERDKYDLTPAHHAAQQTDLTTLKQLLRNGRDPNVRGANGWTPLFSAVVVNNKEAVTVLLDAGADVNARSDNGNTPLHHASDVVSPILLARKPKIDVQNKQGWTPLHSAAFFGRIETVRLLLAAGASATAKSVDGKTPLQLAREKKHTKVIALFETVDKSGAEPSAPAKPPEAAR